MPGRQLTAPKVPRRTKGNPRKRSLNALAIATNTNPDDLKVRQHRLGETEGRGKAGKQVTVNRDDGYGSNLVSQTNGSMKGRSDLDVDDGSDSEGNQWRLGQVGSDEDSDIDSDEAMGEGDEDRFEGFTFRGSTSGKHKSARKQSKVQLRGKDADISFEEPEESSGNESDRTDSSLGEDAIDLAAMLDDSAEVEQLIRMSSVERDVGVHSGSATEESGPDNGGEDESILSMSGDEEAVDPARLSALQNLISSLESSAQEPATKRQRVSEVNESRAPFEFGIGSSQKLTVADLIPSVANHSLRKSLRIIATSDLKSSSSRTGIPSKLEVPLAKRQQDRLDRNAAYEKSKETLNRWVDTVKHNRRAEHLSFPLPDPSGEAASGTRRLPIASSEPLNELESAIQNILQDSGLVTPNSKTDETKIRSFEELQTNKMPLAEVEARRTQLRMARELLFREEIRAKRIKKIKSKSYRRVRRKQREKAENGAREALALAGVKTSDDEDHNDRRRAEERMGARHRESKWAKAMRGSGRGAWDEDTRTGIVEMARRGEELRRRIKGKSVGNAGGDPELSSDDTSDGNIHSDDSGEEGSGGEGEARKLLSQLLKVGHSSYSSDQWLGSTSKLSSLKFMQKAEAARKAENDAAAQNLWRELAGEDYFSDKGLTSFVGRKKYGLDKPPKGTGMNGCSSNKSENGSNSEKESTVEIGLDVDVGMEGSPEKQRIGKWPVHPRVSSRDGGSGTTTEPKVSTNPWIVQKEVVSQRRQQRDEMVDRKQSTGSKISSRIKASRTAASSTDGKLDAVIIDHSLVLKASKPAQARKNPTATSSNAFHSTDSWKSVAMAPEMGDNNSEDEGLNIPVSITNHELVRRAFAGDDVVEEFEMEKQKTICDEEEKMIDNSLPGWGSWTGAGVSKKEEKRNKGQVLLKKEGIREDKRRDAKLDRVIVNEKRVKKVRIVLPFHRIAC
jgi:U3 small nucleolar RNA-associated protein 14